MLVLTRKVRERLYIGDDVCVTVLRLASGQVRLGIEAPRDVSVVRAELVDRTTRARRRPSGSCCPRPQPADHDPTVASRGSRKR